MSISQQALATIQPRPPVAHNLKPQRFSCPCCGYNFSPDKEGKPRSLKQHRRQWKIFSTAHYHWPVSHTEQFVSVDDLRSWLTVQAGWKKESARIPLVGVKAEYAQMLLSTAFKATDAHAYPEIHKATVVIYTPASISFSNMSHANFCKYCDDIAAIIQREMNVTITELLSDGIVE